MDKKDMLTVGELAKRMDVTVRTLQYYDREGLLIPSSLSGGGRRLYSQKDVVKLHQILSLKHLGLPLNKIKNMITKLDAPNDVLEVLEKQKRYIEAQIGNLQSAQSAIEVLQKEILQIDTVDFTKYADIISLFSKGNEYYWVWKYFDQTLSTHVHEKYEKHPQEAEKILYTYRGLLNETMELKNRGILPSNDLAVKLAEKWWDMVKEFVDGDLSLIPQLEKFNNNKDGWDEEMAAKQKEVDEFLGLILNEYFILNGIENPESEE